MKVLYRIPRWWLAAYAPDVPRAYAMFQEFLAGLSLSLTGLAKDIGVDQSTVSRWAVGRSHPTPEQMKALLGAVQSRISAIVAAAERAGRATEALDGVTQAVLDSKSGSHRGLQNLRGAARKLHEVLRESGAEPSPKRRQSRRRNPVRVSKVSDA